MVELPLDSYQALALYLLPSINKMGTKKEWAMSEFSKLEVLYKVAQLQGFNILDGTSPKSFMDFKGVVCSKTARQTLYIDVREPADPDDIEMAQKALKKKTKHMGDAEDDVSPKTARCDHLETQLHGLYGKCPKGRGLCYHGPGGRVERCMGLSAEMILQWAEDIDACENGKKTGVTLEKPPTDRLFSRNLLARAEVFNATNPYPSPVSSFANVVTPMRGPRSRIALLATPTATSVGESSSTIMRPGSYGPHGFDMSMETFVKSAGLPLETLRKLIRAEFESPHHLLAFGLDCLHLPIDRGGLGMSLGEAGKVKHYLWQWSWGRLVGLEDPEDPIEGGSGWSSSG